jgi:hypothetical protein
MQKYLYKCKNPACGCMIETNNDHTITCPICATGELFLMNNNLQELNEKVQKRNQALFTFQCSAGISLMHVNPLDLPEWKTPLYLSRN